MLTLANKPKAKQSPGTDNVRQQDYRKGNIELIELTNTGMNALALVSIFKYNNIYPQLSLNCN